MLQLDLIVAAEAIYFLDSRARSRYVYTMSGRDACAIMTSNEIPVCNVVMQCFTFLRLMR